MDHKTIPIFGSTYITASETPSIDLLHYIGYSAQFVYVNVTPVAGPFTANVTDICTKANHGFTTGLLVRVASDTTLPDGLVAGTDYYVIVGGPNTFSLTDSLAHALAGTDIINILDAGTGIHTITPTALGGSSVKLSGSNDNVAFTDLASLSGNITATGSLLINQSGIYYRWIKASFALTSGQVMLSGNVVTKAP